MGGETHNKRFLSGTGDERWAFAAFTGKFQLSLYSFKVDLKIWTKTGILGPHRKPHTTSTGLEESRKTRLTHSVFHRHLHGTARMQANSLQKKKNAQRSRDKDGGEFTCAQKEADWPNIRPLFFSARHAKCIKCASPVDDHRARCWLSVQKKAASGSPQKGLKDEFAKELRTFRCGHKEKEGRGK